MVTIASTMSFTHASGVTDYTASKHAVWGMHECLRLELSQYRREGSRRVDTSLVCPFATATGMFDGILFPWWSRPLLPTLTPEYVAGQVVDAIVAERGRPLVIMPWALRWLPFVLRLVLPVRLLDWCADLFGATIAMNAFKGRRARRAG